MQPNRPGYRTINLSGAVPTMQTAYQKKNDLFPFNGFEQAFNELTRLKSDNYDFKPKQDGSNRALPEPFISYFEQKIQQM